MEKSLKKALVLYPSNQKFHTIYDPTIELFSKKYALVYSPPKRSKFYKIKNNKFLRESYYSLLKVSDKFLKLKKKNKISKKNPKKCLLFCFNSLPQEEFDFILDLEIITGLGGYNYNKLDKEYISNRLSSDRCKAIICWNESSYVSLINTIDCSNFKNKIKIIPFARKRSNLKKTHKKTLNLLFVSSINNPHDFEGKGGLIVLEAYSTLAKKFKNINFFVRANVSREIMKKYRNVSGLIFIRQILSEKKMKELFLKSDILLEPIPGISLVLECMDFGIPIVSFNFWCISEMVENMKSGLIVNSSSILGNLKDTDNYFKNMGSNYKHLSDEKKYRPFVKEFAKKIEFLIKNKEVLKKMKKYQISLLEDGKKYSLAKRNKALLKVVDSAIA